MDSHLDVHYSDFPRAFPCIGTIKAIKPKDHANNPTGTFTVYDLTVHLQWPPINHDYEDVPALGQMAAGGVELEITYVVDQTVVVLFLEGDPNRPAILCPFPSHDTAVAHAAGEGPRIRVLANGAEILIDKDGNIVLGPKSGQFVYLGGESTDVTMKRLLHEQFVSTLSGIFTGAAVAAGDGGATLKGNIASALNASVATANSTDNVKGT